MREVTLVYGPPCSGKSTYVQELAQPGDVVLDLDAIAQELGSRERWDHSPYHVRMANEVWRERARSIGQSPDVRAWVIRGAPSRHQRRTVARLVGATAMQLMLPDLETLLARAHRRPQPRRTIEAIQSWLARYSPDWRTVNRSGLHNDRGERKRRAAVVRAWRAKYGDWCPGYGVPAHPAEDLTADHDLAVAAGGDEAGALSVLCRGCNGRKGDGRRAAGVVVRSMDW